MGGPAIIPSERDGLLPSNPDTENTTSTTNAITEPLATPEATQLKGYLFMIISALCYALVTFFVHVAETKYHLPMASAIVVRAGTSLTMSTIYMMYNRLLHTLVLPPKQWLRLGARGILGATTAALSFAAAARIPIGTLVTLMYTSPALTSILAALFLHDVFSLRLVGILAINFMGIVLVSRPALTLTDPHMQQLAVEGTGLALVSAFTASCVFVLVRSMGLQVHFVLGVFAYGFGCVLVSLVIADAHALQQIRDNVPGMLFALASGISGFGSQTMLNRGLQLCPAGPAIVVRSITVPVSFVLGLIFLGEVPSFWSIVGVGIVMSSIVAIAYVKLALKRQSGELQLDEGATKV